jgi:hypothetical protein
LRSSKVLNGKFSVSKVVLLSSDSLGKTVHFTVKGGIVVGEVVVGGLKVDNLVVRGIESGTKLLDLSSGSIKKVSEFSNLSLEVHVGISEGLDLVGEIGIDTLEVGVSSLEVGEFHSQGVQLSRDVIELSLKLSIRGSKHLNLVGEVSNSGLSILKSSLEGTDLSGESIDLVGKFSNLSLEVLVRLG